MEILFLKLVNMSIVASWVVLVVILFRLLFKKAPKYIRCFMWALVAVRLICPFSFESSFSLIPSIEVLPDEILTGPSFDVNTGVDFVDNRVNDYLGDRYFEGISVATGAGFNTMRTSSILWLIGMVVMLSYTIISYIHIRRQVREAVEFENNIWLCDHIATPFILGVFKPRIFLPSSMSEADIEYVVAHERAHLKRCDHLWKPFGFLLLMVYWFNPVIWVAYILLCRDIELACDENVIKSMGLEDKKSYSEALINCSMPRKMIAACPLAFGEVGVKERIKTVLNYKKPAFWIVVIALVVCVTVGVCFITNPAGIQLRNGDNTELPDYITISSTRGATSKFTVYSTGDSTGEERSYEITSESSIIYVLDFLEDIEVSRKEISKNRSEDRDKSNMITLHYGNTYTSYCFNSDCTEVWINDTVKPSLSKKVYNQDIVLQFFESCIEYYVSNVDGVDESTYGTIMPSGVYKQYTYTNSVDYSAPTILLHEEEKLFTFSYSPLSSYLPYGEYELTDDTLTLRTSDGFYVYVFDVVNNGFVFNASKSSKIPPYRYSSEFTKTECPVPDGALFEALGITIP